MNRAMEVVNMDEEKVVRCKREAVRPDLVRWVC